MRKNKEIGLLITDEGSFSFTLDNLEESDVEYMLTFLKKSITFVLFL